MTDASLMKPPLHRSDLMMFSPEELRLVNDSVSMAEDLVSSHYKMSASQWQRLRYDVRTLKQLHEGEIVDGPFAQVIRYEAKRDDTPLGSAVYDFYKICLQDHAILRAIGQSDGLLLLPFCLYIVTHELIHIVRFCRFLQGFDASEEEKMAEEIRVHQHTRDIIEGIQIPGKTEVLHYYRRWCGNCEPVDRLR